MANGDYLKYRATEEYVTVVVDPGDSRNKKYAKLLLDDYASSGSELTAVTQYVYASILATKNPTIAETFLGIGIVEMGHLDLLGDTILALGVKPKYLSAKGKYWNSSVVPYGESTKNRLKLAIEGEKAAIKQYTKHIKEIKNDSIKTLLTQIIADEKLHIQLFKELLEALEK